MNNKQIMKELYLVLSSAGEKYLKPLKPFIEAVETNNSSSPLQVAGQIKSKQNILKENSFTTIKLSCNNETISELNQLDGIINNSAVYLNFYYSDLEKLILNNPDKKSNPAHVCHFKWETKHYWKAVDCYVEEAPCGSFIFRSEHNAILKHSVKNSIIKSMFAPKPAFKHDPINTKLYWGKIIDLVYDRAKNRQSLFSQQGFIKPVIHKNNSVTSEEQLEQ